MLVLFSLIASGASTILAGIAIWIALYGKAEADKTNQKTQEMLTEIRSDAKSIAQVAMPELKAYGDSVRRYIFKEEGAAPDSGVERIEKSVNEAMDKIMNELREVKETPDLNTAFARLKKVEAQIEQSRKTIEESVREGGGLIVIHSKGEQYAFRADRRAWHDVVNHLMRMLGFERKDYGITWEIANMNTHKTLSPEEVFDTNLSLEAVGIRSGDNVVLTRI